MGNIDALAASIDTVGLLGIRAGFEDMGSKRDPICDGRILRALVP